MIGSLIGAGISAAGSILGGIKSSQAMKKYRKGVQSEIRKNNDWFDRHYHEDATQRADSQAILTRTEDAVRRRNRAAAGARAVMGGTEESVAASKAANNEALASAASTISANAELRKDNIEAQYRQRDGDLHDKLNQTEVKRANAIASAIKGVSSAAGSIGSALDSNPWGAKSKSETGSESGGSGDGSSGANVYDDELYGVKGK